MSIVGSPGYMAPEIIDGKHGRAVYDHNTQRHYRVDVNNPPPNMQQNGQANGN